MNKKAFTMIELLAVLIIIGLIGIVSFPALTNTAKKMEEKEYQRYLNDIYLATETYISIHRLEYEDLNTAGKMVNIPVSKLISAELLDASLKDPQTEETIDISATVRVTVKTDLTYQYEYIPS